MRLIDWPNFAMHVAWDCAASWFTSRPVPLLLWGAPAVCVAALLLGVLDYARRVSPTRLLEQYRAAARKAIENEDFQLAELCLQKMVHIEPTVPIHRYGLAMLQLQNGDKELGGAMMHELAPPTGDRGFPDADYWVAGEITRRSPQLGQNDQDRVRFHLERALAADAHHVRSLEMLGRLELAQRQPEAALACFQKALGQRPTLHSLVARLQLLTGKDKDARRTAEAGLAIFRKQAAANPEDPESYLLLADLQVILGRFTEAQATLIEAARRAPDDGYRIALAGVYASWFDALKSSEPEQLVQQLEILNQALRLAPNDPRLLLRLAKLAVREHGEEARRLLEAALARGRAPAILHFVLGTSALQEGEHERGLRHLQLAFAQEPQMPAIANNLAWALAHAPEPQLERARQIIQSAVELAPHEPEIRETRGQILAKLGNHHEAIADLEYALQKLPARTDIHGTLAQLYDAVGDPTLAAQHRVQAGKNHETHEIHEKEQEKVQEKAEGAGEGIEGAGEGVEGAGEGVEGAGEGVEGAGEGVEGAGIVVGVGEGKEQSQER